MTQREAALEAKLVAVEQRLTKLEAQVVSLQASTDPVLTGTPLEGSLIERVLSNREAVRSYTADQLQLLVGALSPEDRQATLQLEPSQVLAGLTRQMSTTFPAHAEVAKMAADLSGAATEYKFTWAELGIS